MKDYGFSKLSKYLRDVDGVVVGESDSGASVFPDCE